MQWLRGVSFLMRCLFELFCARYPHCWRLERQKRYNIHIHEWQFFLIHIFNHIHSLRSMYWYDMDKIMQHVRFYLFFNVVTLLAVVRENLCEVFAPKTIENQSLVLRFTTYIEQFHWRVMMKWASLRCLSNATTLARSMNRFILCMRLLNHMNLNFKKTKFVDSYESTRGKLFRCDFIFRSEYSPSNTKIDKNSIKHHYII